MAQKDENPNWPGANQLTIYERKLDSGLQRTNLASNKGGIELKVVTK